MLVISSLLIFARTLYRLAETAEGEPRPGQSWGPRLIDIPLLRMSRCLGQRIVHRSPLWGFRIRPGGHRRLDLARQASQAGDDQNVLDSLIVVVTLFRVRGPEETVSLYRELCKFIITR